MVHLISDKMVELVEKYADEILVRWVDRLLQDETAISFKKRNLKFIKENALYILRHLGDFVSYDTKKEQIGKRYSKLGIDLFNHKFPLCEVFRSLVLLRRMLWLFVVNESTFDSAYHLHQMRELNDRVILFFDRIQYYLTRGYMEEMHRKLKSFNVLNPDQCEEIFFENSFYDR